MDKSKSQSATRLRLSETATIKKMRADLDVVRKELQATYNFIADRLAKGDSMATLQELADVRKTSDLLVESLNRTLIQMLLYKMLAALFSERVAQLEQTADNTCRR